MAFTDPQSVTINAVPTSLPRVSDEATKSVYSSPDETLQLTISHQASTGRQRHMVRIDQMVVAADPLTAVNQQQTLGVYVVVDQPNFGFSDTNINYVVQALTAWLSATNVGKVLGREH